MKTITICALAVVCTLTQSWAKPLTVIGEDSADQGDYSSGWQANTGGAAGFGKWTMQIATESGVNSNAGFYVASTNEKQDLKGAAIGGKAFGMYANGVGFEVATAYRPFEKPLKVGQSFSFLMEHGEIQKKFDTDAPNASGSIGLTLSSTTDSATTDQYNKDVRFEIGYYQQSGAYTIYDGDGTKKLDVPVSAGALSVTFTLVTADTYDLEITVVATKETSHITSRKLGGIPASPISSFCLFDRNGETNDAYFNGFQLLQPTP